MSTNKGHSKRDKEPRFSILPHPATSNDPADLQRDQVRFSENFPGLAVPEGERTKKVILGPIVPANDV
ncbi:hypothetical protein Clacol_007256 [Clathrus columnatus]|uniref:Uncharacterized protein n=1 Tax=Clathrus columnatus TaxID=1419009 RepID=A0AAV5AEE2_9AGAM|nr:hypothetical protein Clacol_007256 [Clathrus columnatus]